MEAEWSTRSKSCRVFGRRHFAFAEIICQRSIQDQRGSAGKEGEAQKDIDQGKAQIFTMITVLLEQERKPC